MNQYEMVRQLILISFLCRIQKQLKDWEIEIFKLNGKSGLNFSVFSTITGQYIKCLKLLHTKNMFQSFFKSAISYGHCIKVYCYSLSVFRRKKYFYELSQVWASAFFSFFWEFHFLKLLSKSRKSKKMRKLVRCMTVIFRHLMHAPAYFVWAGLATTQKNG